MNLRHPLILASNSPRRQQLLREAGFEFQVYTEDFEEGFPEEMEPAKVAEYLACVKNEHYRKVLERSIILTADTTVLLGNTLLNKPADEKEAFNMLSQLSAKTHQVVTGVCLSYGEKTEAFSDVTSVVFRKLSETEIQHYIEKYRPLDKAGAYGIQEWIGMIGIERIEGSYFNVMGLPIHKVYEKLEQYSV